MIIRKAKESDINNNLLILYNEGYNMHYENRKDIFNSKKIMGLKNDLIDMLKNPEEFLFVIEEDNKILGYAALRIKDKVTKTIWIDEIIIDGNYRNKGYGKKMIEQINTFAKENECKRIELNCWSFNENALNFYNKLGFVEQRVIFEKKVK